jgi:pentatricopeptide repeat protein
VPYSDADLAAEFDATVAFWRRWLRQSRYGGRWREMVHYGTDVLDASLLLIPLCKFIAPTDPRWISTLDAITAELVSDSLVYRYNVDASPDGLADKEASFSLCFFWWVEALARAGRLDEARLAFEKMLTYANHVGPYSEEIGPTGEQLGNLPRLSRTSR